MQLNRNNYLIWEGEFTDKPTLVQAVDDAVNMSVGAVSVEIYPLLNDVATYGIDLNTFEFTVQDNLLKPATFDPLTKKITYYLPAGAAVDDVRVIKYRWKDTLAHQSNEATISITVIARATGWRGYASSLACVLDGGGHNTGESAYGELEEYYLDDNSPVLPSSTKANDPGDPDYIAPTTNLIMCPLYGTDVDVRVYNLVAGIPYPPTIHEVNFYTAGHVLAFSFSPELKKVDSQPASCLVTAQTYETIEIVYDHEPESGFPVEYVMSLYTDGGAGDEDQDVLDSEDTIIFNDVTLIGGSSPSITLRNHV